MGSIVWGLLGPDTTGGARRTRTLGLGTTVRAINDRAVPGMGGVWFGKQLLLAVLGVAIGERLRERGNRAQNIEVADAVEALACWLGLKSNGWKMDLRLRGHQKLHGRTDLSYATVKKKSFYVTQPMRQTTLQPLRALGLVEASGERFNAFKCTETGREFIEVACSDFRPRRLSVLAYLEKWASGERDDVQGSGDLSTALSPIEPLSKGARDFLHGRIVAGDGADVGRRRSVLKWLNALRDNSEQQVKWDQRAEAVDEIHWKDLEAGALFFATRDAAILLLDQVESSMGKLADRRFPLDGTWPGSVRDCAAKLRVKAQIFLNQRSASFPVEARTFCLECMVEENSRLLENLLRRESNVLRLEGRTAIPGVAFTGAEVEESATPRSTEEDETLGQPKGQFLPEGISHRVMNMYRLNLDLRDELGEWLGSPEETEGQA